MPDYYGLPVEQLENPLIRLQFLREAGPRVVRLFFGDSDTNLLAEMPDFVLPTPYGAYHFQGGHRLWHAPEALPRSYLPDSSGLEIQAMSGGVCLLAPVEAASGVQKSMEIVLDPARPQVTVVHRLENAGLWPLELAPWAITQMASGGLALLPQQADSDPRNALLPDRLLSIWSYTMLHDPRLSLNDDLILVGGAAQQPPCKIGTRNKRGWLGYLQHGVLFVKRFTPQLDRPHVDFGCNSEIYVDHRFLEIETLGPLARLEPGQSVAHTESWELTGGLDYPPTLDGMRALVRDLRLDLPFEPA